MSDELAAPPTHNFTVTSAQWTDSSRTAIAAIINDINCFVPVEPLNAHYMAIEAWVAEGNAIAAPPPAPGP
jgi:hypothetical protein